jgi:WhiB family transcriptional regulator, redox-sensing transcriptional regulator
MANLTRLPGPNADRWDWQLEAACRGMDSGVFFHPDRERGEAREVREADAKRICATCPVRLQCLEHALRVREPYGVWGGRTEHERLELIRSSRRRDAG